MATLPGEPLYAALGFSAIERVTLSLSGDVDMPLVRMTRAINDVPAPALFNEHSR